MSLNKYVGIPFISNGRDYSGCDCWGLVRLYYKDELNIDLPSFSSDYTETDTLRMEELINQYREGWVSQESPEIGSVILFRVFGKLSHIGIYIGGNKFLHAIEGNASAVQSVNSPEWKKRIVGYYKYKTGASLTAVPHPLKTEKIYTAIPSGTKLGELSGWVQKEYNISSELATELIILINGKIVLDPDYEIKDSDVVEYRALPGKSAFRLVLVAALVALAPQIGFQLGLPGISATYAAGTSAITGYAVSGVAGALSIAAVNVVGTLLIDKIAPIRAPEQIDPGTPKAQYLFNGGANTASRYQSIPVILGKVRITPPIAANTYTESTADSDSYITTMLCWGYGPLNITDLRIGGTELKDFNTIETDSTGTAKSSLTEMTYYGDGNASARSSVLKIYGSKDIEQFYSGTKLTSDGTDSGSTWLEYTFNQKISSFTVAINFPQGLRRVKVKGDGAGTSSELTFIGQIQYIKLSEDGVTPIGDWTNIDTFSLDDVYTVPLATYGNLYTWYKVAIGVDGIVTFAGTPTQNPDQEPDATTLALLANKSYKSPTGSFKAKPEVPTEYAPICEVCVVSATGYQPAGGETEYAYTYTSIVRNNSIKNTLKYDYYDLNATIDQPAYSNEALKISSGFATDLAQAGNISIKDTRIGRNPFTIDKTVTLYGKNEYGRYKVRVRRLDNSETYPDGNENYQNFHDAYLNTITGKSDILLGQNPLVLNPPNCDLALTAIKLKATENINGSLEGINGFVETIALDYLGGASTGGLWKLQPTNNPASLFRYVLSHPAGAERVSQAQFDLPAIEHWHHFCKTNGFEFNDIITNQRSILEVLRDICAAGRASPTIVDGKWSVIIDEPKSLITQHFTPHNSWGFESVKLLPKKPHAFRVKYLDEDSGYQQSEVVVPNIGYTEATAELFEELEFPGITSAALAIKHARWHLAQLRLRPETYTLNTDMEYLVCNRGDLVRVAHDVPMWGSGTGRVKSVSGNTISLDEPVYLEVGRTYVIRYRTNSGSSVVRTISTILDSDYYTTVTTTTTPTGIASGNLFIIGINNIESTELVVLSVEPFGDKNAKLVLTDYAPDIFTINFDSEYPPVYDPRITLPAKNLIDSITDAPILNTNFIRSDESVLKVLSPGVFEVNISVSVPQALTLAKEISHVEIQAQLSTNPQGTWDYKVLQPLGKSNALISDVIEGAKYYIRARYTALDGRTGPWSNTVEHTVVGKRTPPSSVQNFDGVVLIQDAVLQASWSSNPEPDFSFYEIRTENNNWGLSGYVWRGSGTKVDLPLATAGTQITYYIKAVDYSKNYSLVSAVKSISVDAPNPPTNIQSAYSTASSRTNSTVTITWTPATRSQNGLEIKEYLIEFQRPGMELETARISATTYTTRADWLGDALVSIKTIDTSNNLSISAQKTIVKVAPAAVIDAYAEVVDNNVFLRWTLPDQTSLPISHVLIKRGNVWETPQSVVGEKSGTFTSVIELAGGQYNYMIASVDTDSRESVIVNVPTTVSQPPDFIFNVEYTGDFSGASTTLVNSFIETNTGNLLMLVDTAESWESHFSTRSWTGPQSQIDAGYPIYSQPGVETASYSEVFDYGTILANSSITISYTGKIVSGAPSVSLYIQTSSNGSTWTDPEYASSTFATSFRYVKLTFTCSRNAPGDLYLLEAITARLDSKQKTDGGKATAVSTDTLGTIVNFNSDKEFVDVVSITVTPNATTPVISVYDFKDAVLSGTYVLATNGICTITVTDHGLETGQSVRLNFISGEAISGIYTVTKVSSNIYTVNMGVLYASSGNVSTYPQSMRVYLFDNSGVRQNGSFGWALRGY